MVRSQQGRAQPEWRQCAAWRGQGAVTEGRAYRPFKNAKLEYWSVLESEPSLVILIFIMIVVLHQNRAAVGETLFVILIWLLSYLHSNQLTNTSTTSYGNYISQPRILCNWLLSNTPAPVASLIISRFQQTGSTADSQVIAVGATLKQQKELICICERTSLAPIVPLSSSTITDSQMM